MNVLNGQRPEVLLDLVARARLRLGSVRPAPAGAAAREELVADTAAQIVAEFQAERLESGLAALDEAEERGLAVDVIARLHGNAGLTALLADESIEDIWGQGADTVWVRRVGGGVEQVAPIAESDDSLVELIRTLAVQAGVSEQERRFDSGSPILDLRLPGGERLHAVMGVSPLPSFAIRRHTLLRADFAELCSRRMFSPIVGQLLEAIMRARANVVVCGRTGAGKTTLLRGMLSLLDVTERLVTIEDTYELDLHTDPAHPNTVALQGRQPNVEGAGEITLATLFRSGLRMNPSRVVVGEVRGDELVVMLHAMNQGNDGSLSTIHASSSQAVFSKMMAFGASSPERLDRAAMAQLIADGVDFVVFLDQVPGADRVVSSIREVVSADAETVVSNEIARPGADRRAEPYVRPSETWLSRLVEHGWDPTDWGRWQ
jgi:pilus assembly protein CpaF